MVNVTLKHLRYFDALERHGHFGRAAEASAISQPALSVQIRDLEEVLGCALFERGPRQVRLTAFGEAFAPRARDILRAVDELGDLARAAKGPMQGRLRIGVIPTIAPYLLPGLIGTLGTAHRDLDLHVRETVTPRLIEALSHGQIDCAVVALPISEPSFVEVPLFSEKLVLVRPAGDASKPAPDREALRAMRLLLLEEGHCFRDQALSFCGLPQAGPREGLDGSALSTLVQMVGAGLGVTLLPEMALGVELRAAPVCAIRLAAPEPERTIGMIWRRSSPLAEALHEIGAAVRQSAQSLYAAEGAATPP